jgi:hypothetical protein
VSVDKLQSCVIPASKARRESFWKEDSGQAGMTEKGNLQTTTYEINSPS